MLVIRYYWWLIVYTFMVCYKIPLRDTLNDIVHWPTHVFDNLMKTKSEQKAQILFGMKVMKHYWSYHAKPAMPPAFVVKKLLLIEAEARS